MFCQFWCVCPLHCVCVCVCVCIIAFSAFDFKNWIALKRNEEKNNLKSEVESVCVEERERERESKENNVAVMISGKTLAVVTFTCQLADR